MAYIELLNFKGRKVHWSAARNFSDLSPVTETNCKGATLLQLSHAKVAICLLKPFESQEPISQ